MRRLFLILLCSTALLGVVACSGDDDTGGGDGDAEEATDDSVTGEVERTASEEWCERAATDVEALAAASDELPDEEVTETFQALTDDAPEQIQPALQVLTDAYSQLAQVDSENVESFDEVTEVLFDPEVVAASEQLGLFLEEECGADVETPSEAEEGDESDEASGDGPGFDSSALRDFLEAEDPDLESRVQTIASFAGLEVTVGIEQLTDPAEAVEICELVSTYAYDQAGAEGMSIIVGDTELNDLATRDGADGTCEPV